MPTPYSSFTERVVRTQAVELIQVTCLTCGFIAVGRKEQVRRVAKEHRGRCHGHVLLPKKPAQSLNR